jgi:Protein of unknown function (DUF3592)
MMKFFFRILLFALGAFLTYTFGRAALEPIWLSFSGEKVEGRVSGFLAQRNATTIYRESTGLRNNGRKARRPVFKYPVGADSLEARSSTAATLFFGNYELHEQVTVVYSKSNPASAYILGWQLIGGAFLCALFGLYMLRMGLLAKD